MVELYLACLIIGGLLVGASVLAGGHAADADHDAPHGGGQETIHEVQGAEQGADPPREIWPIDHGFDHGHDLDQGHAPAVGVDHSLQSATHAEGVAHELVAGHGPGEAHPLWLPFLSLRFWTFFFAFFGLTGTVLSAFGLMAALPTLLTAVLIGGGSGTGVAWAVHTLTTHPTGVAAGPQDFLGREATVMVRLGPGRTGQIRLSVQDEAVELLATADEEVARGESVVIYEMDGPLARVQKTLLETAEGPAGLLPPPA